MKQHKKKQDLTTEALLKRYKKRYHAALGVLAALIALAAFYLYMNYDYLAFKHFLTSSYIYTDTMDEVFQKELGTDVKGKYFKNFDDMVIAVVTKRIREEKGDRYTYLYTPSHLIQYRQEEKQEAAASQIKVLNDKTLYLKLTNFSPYTLKFMQDNIDQLKSRENIIIDLLDNRGGDIDAMVDISSMFLLKKAVVATDQFRWWKHVYQIGRAHV